MSPKTHHAPHDLPATNGTPTAGALLEKNGKVGVALGLFFSLAVSIESEPVGGLGVEQLW